MQYVVEYNLFIAINMMIDIATHIVIDNNIGSPETFGEVFSILNKEKYLTEISISNIFYVLANQVNKSVTDSLIVIKNTRGQFSCVIF